MTTMMQYEIPACPECGGPAHGTLEVVRGIALLQGNPATGYEYGGETEIWWDEQRSVTDDQGRVTLVCYHGHDWQSALKAAVVAELTEVGS